MPTYVAFLRAINVGGRLVSSDRLADLFVDLGLDNVRTFLASGNVVFSASEPADDLEPRIEAHLEEELGYDVASFVRTLETVTDLASRTPFDVAATNERTKTYVVFARTTLDANQTDTLAGLETNVDQFVPDGRHIFWLRHVEAGESMPTSELESAIDSPLTRRTMRTLERLASKFA